MPFLMNDMRKLAILAEIASSHGHRVSESADSPHGTSGDVRYGLDAGGAFIELWARRISEDEAKTLVSDLLNGIYGAYSMAFRQEHFRNDANSKLSET